MRGPLVQLRRNWRTLTGGFTAVVFAFVLLAAPVLAAGTLQLTPPEGPAGDEFQISGDGFEPSEKVKLKWDGRGFGSPVRADTNGAFTTTRSAPIDAPPGKHTVSATGIHSGLSAEAIFTVLDPAATTTTTTSPVTTTSPATTIATDGETTTPTTNGKTTTPTTAGETTTTSPAPTIDEGSWVVHEYGIRPAEATPGTQIEIAGVLTGKLSKVQFSLDGERLGNRMALEDDGSFRTTRILPDLSPGTYWLSLETPNGKVLATRKLEVITAADDGVARAGLGSSGDFDVGGLLTTPMGLAGAVGMPLVAAMAVWWMWRRPSGDEETSRQ